MSGPKLQRIIDAVADRLALVHSATGFYSDCGENVFRDRREPAEHCLPCFAVFFGERTATQTRNNRAACDLEINVFAYARAGEYSAEQLGIELLADIQKAVEVGDMSLGGLVRDRDGAGLAFASEEIFLPEIGASAVGARVTYFAPNVRKAGDPEIE